MSIISMHSQVKCIKLHIFQKQMAAIIMIMYLSFTKIMWNFKAHITHKLIYKHIWIENPWIHVKHVWWNCAAQRGFVAVDFTDFVQIKLCSGIHEALLFIILQRFIYHKKRNSITVDMLYSSCRSAHQNRNNVHSNLKFNWFQPYYCHRQPTIPTLVF